MKSILLSFIAVSFFGSASAADPDPATVSAAIKRSADWGLANPSGIDTRDWVIAPLYDGLMRTATVTNDAKYLAAVMRFGNQSGWMAGNRVYHADDHAVGHAWLDVYQMDPSRKERLSPMQDRMDYVISNPVKELLAHGKKPETRGVSVSDRWSWCDALYMAPPTLARLYAITGDKKYLEFLDHEYQSAYDNLYDPEEHLFFRDATYLDKKTPGGKKTFWSRGNGWVYGGLALMLDYLPADHAKRGFYENLFREMTGAVIASQQPDGLWRPSMLDVEQIPLGETSGSGFFVFGLAWGVNNGLLERDEYWPAIVRGWNGLMTRTRPDGFVGYVQSIGSAPAPLGADSIQDYGTGAFLLAGSEVLRGLGGAAKTDSAALLAAADAILAAEEKTPRAYARMVPERLDDLAWENDKVAFRVYGPAARSRPEDSGVDVWCKRVDYPILDKWYREDLTNGKSYHKDHGEGYDGYHVGDTRGCGGLGLWIDGKLVTSDTYLAGRISWTSPDVAEFKSIYGYPVKVGGKQVFERRTTRLHLGERLFEVESYFSHDKGRNGRPMKKIDHEVAVGIVSQNSGAKVDFDPETGFLSVYEPLNGKGLGTGIVMDPKRIIRMEELAATDPKKKNEQVLLVTRPDDRGRVNYRSGFAWAGDDDITTAQQWLDYLKKQAARK